MVIGCDIYFEMEMHFRFNEMFFEKNAAFKLTQRPLLGSPVLTVVRLIVVRTCRAPCHHHKDTSTVHIINYNLFHPSHIIKRNRITSLQLA